MEGYVKWGGSMIEIVPGEERINERERLAELQSRFSYAESYRKQYDEKAIDSYKLYVGYRDAKDGRSNLHIPRTYEQLDTLRSRLVKAFAGARPYLDFIPTSRPETTLDQVHSDAMKAKIASALVDMQLERNNWQQLFYEYVTAYLIFPAAVMGVGWKFDRRIVRRKVEIPKVMGIDPFGQPIVTTEMQVIETPEIAWDDNELVNIDYFDFWPDPRGRDVDSCRFVFHREWMTREQIEERMEVLYQAGAGEVFVPDWDKVEGASGLEEGRWERLSSVGLTPTTNDGYWPKEGTGQLYEVLNYWEDETYAIMVNRNALVYEGKNPYWRHSKKPFIVSTYEPLPNEFYGLSAVQLVSHLQHEINTHRNQRIDNVSFILNRMWKVRRGADIDESELVSRPHGIIYVDNPDDVMELQMSDITSSSYTEEQIAKMDMENTLGVPAVVRGAETSKRETATETVTKSSNAGIRFDVKIMLFEAMGFKRMAHLMDCNNQQFIDTPRLVRLAGGVGEEWRMIQPGEIIGEFDYRPAGASIDPAANKEIRRQQLGQLLTLAVQTQLPFINIYELTKMFVESFDIRTPEKVLRTPEEIQQEMMQQQMQQQAMEQQVPMEPPQQAPQLPPELMQQLLLQGGGP